MKYLLTILYLTYSLGSYSQQHYYNQRQEFLKANSIWAFGNYAGLDFNVGIASPMATQMTGPSGGGCASVSDPLTGRLLFYSNGDKIWDASHQLMSNGKDLLDNTSNYPIQCVSIVPVIDTPGKYYIFSLAKLFTFGALPSSGTLFYSVVDMSLNNGMGNVVAGQKKVMLSTDTLSNAMIAIPGNCGDIWLMTHTYANSKFLAFHITKEGISSTPVISTSIANFKYDGASVLAVSPDRQKVAITNYGNGTLVGRFDAGTGQINALVALVGAVPNPVGACFSPDNSKLYLTSGFARSGGVYQYDLAVYNSNDIVRSEQIIVRALAGKSFWALKLYNDTVYTYPYSAVDRSLRTICRINQPNLAGSACDYQPDVITLIGDTVVLGSALPNEVVLPLPMDTVYALVLDTAVCTTNFKLEAPAGFNSYVWENGSTTPGRTITAPGTYWVVSNELCRSHLDTFILSGVGFKVSDIRINNHELSIEAIYASYQWLLDGLPIAGATNASHTVLKNGRYQVIVSSKDSCIDTSTIQEITDIEETATHLPDMLPIAVFVYPNPAMTLLNISTPTAVNVVISSIEGKVVRQLHQVKLVDIHDLAKGVYLIHITDSRGNFIKVEKIVIQ